MSQAEIGNLRVRLGIDTAQFANGVKQAQGSISGLSKSLKGLAVGLGASLSLAGVTAALRNTITRIDEVGEAAEKAGMSSEAFSKLEYAARVAGLGMDALTTTMGRFSKSLSQIAAGGENDAGEVMRMIGISALDAQGKLRPTGDIIVDIAEKFSGMRDSANKTALAIALFGRAGAEMIPFLNGGREAITKATEEAERFGLVVDDKSAKAAAQFNDNVTRLTGAFQGLAQEAIGPIIPQLVDLTEQLIDLVKTSLPVGEWINSLISWFAELKPFIETTRKEIEMITEALRSLGLIDPKPLEIMIPGGGLATGPAVASGVKKDAPAFKPAGASSKSEKLIDPGTIDDIYGAGEAVQALEVTFQEAQWGAGAFSDSLLSIGDSIQNSLSGALSGLITGTMSVQEAFMGMVQSIVQSLADLAAELLTNVAFKFLLQALAGGGGAGFNIGGMAFGGLYANGGYLGSGKWGIAGEAGPEIIHGPARITPMDKMGGGGMNVTVINNTPARVNTSRSADGGLRIEVVEEMVASAMARGGNKIDDAMARGYGLRRAGR
jgi:hypothetical protein